MIIVGTEGYTSFVRLMCAKAVNLWLRVNLLIQIMLVDESAHT